MLLPFTNLDLVCHFQHKEEDINFIRTKSFFDIKSQNFLVD